MSSWWWLEHMLVLLLVYVLLRILWQQQQSTKKRKKKGKRRQWQPKSPKDCPTCQEGVKLALLRAQGRVTPWKEVKSRRGWKKTVPTQGYACPNTNCRYLGGYGCKASRFSWKWEGWHRAGHPTLPLPGLPLFVQFTTQYAIVLSEDCP